MELSEDTINAGLPDTPNPSVLPISKDYSNPENLKLIDSLPIVSLESIDELNCEETGEYTINGKVTSGTLESQKNIEIQFGTPDSTDLCDINVNGENVEMDWHNKEKFFSSSILFEHNIIKDSDGKELFILNSYTNQKSFACNISFSSVLPNNSTITPSGDSNKNSDINLDEEKKFPKISIIRILVELVEELLLV